MKKIIFLIIVSISFCAKSQKSTDFFDNIKRTNMIKIKPEEINVGELIIKYKGEDFCCFPGGNGCEVTIKIFEFKTKYKNDVYQIEWLNLGNKDFIMPNAKLLEPSLNNSGYYIYIPKQTLFYKNKKFTGIVEFYKKNKNSPLPNKK